MNTSMLTSYRRVFWSLAALLISLSRGSFLFKGKYLIEWARLLAKFRIYLFLGDANLIFFFKFTQTNNDWLNVFILFILICFLLRPHFQNVFYILILAPFPRACCIDEYKLILCLYGSFYMTLSVWTNYFNY